MEKQTGVDGIPIELVKCLDDGKKEILSYATRIIRIHGNGVTTCTDEM